MNTTYKNSPYTGWTGRTEIDVPEIPPQQGTGLYTKAVLCVSTCKLRNQAIWSFAKVNWVGGFIAPTLYRDFARHYNTTFCTRATAAAVRAVHEKTLSQLDAIRAEAAAHYLNRAEQVTE